MVQQAQQYYLTTFPINLALDTIEEVERQLKISTYSSNRFENLGMNMVRLLFVTDIDEMVNVADDLSI